MLLTQLRETITVKNAKTTEDLQKMLDATGSTYGIEAVSPKVAKITSSLVNLANIITPGTLPFTVEQGDQDGSNISMTVSIPTLRSLKGLEKLDIGTLIIGQATIYKTVARVIPSKLTTLKGMPHVQKHLVLTTPLLTSLEGLNADVDAKLEIHLVANSKLTMLEHAAVKSIKLIGLQQALRFSHKLPQTVTKLDLTSFVFSTGLPWYVLIPKHVDVELYNNHIGVSRMVLPEELERKLIAMQKAGGTRANMFEIQQDLIEAGFDELAEI